MQITEKYYLSYDDFDTLHKECTTDEERDALTACVILTDEEKIEELIGSKKLIEFVRN